MIEVVKKEGIKYLLIVRSDKPLPNQPLNPKKASTFYCENLYIFSWHRIIVKKIRVDTQDNIVSFLVLHLL